MSGFGTAPAIHGALQQASVPAVTTLLKLIVDAGSARFAKNAMDTLHRETEDCVDELTLGHGIALSELGGACGVHSGGCSR